MSSVLPIDTQHYQSGDYTLEVTAHPSPLSQWSDRPVVRQLRFNLWVDQPERQKLATGNQHQLVTLSTTVESYVQAHLTQQAWPQTHRLNLLDQAIELSTLQLFNLAEVLNAYGHTHITLPAVPKQRRRNRWWTGSAAASLLVAVGVTSLYFQNRPAAWNEAVTSQAPEVALDNAFEDVAPTLTEEKPMPEASSEAEEEKPMPEASSEAEDVSGDGDAELQPAAAAPEKTQELPQPPPVVNNRQWDIAPVAPRPPAPSLEPEPPPPAPPPIEPAAPSIEPEPAAPPPAVAPPAALPPASQSAPAPPAALPPADQSIAEAELAPLEEERFEASIELEESAEDTDALVEEPVFRSSERRLPNVAANEPPRSEARTRHPNVGRLRMGDSSSGADVRSTAEPFSAIAAQLAPYQPPGANYPLVYHLTIAADGTITAIEPITEDAPELDIPTRVTATGRPLKLELTYTGTRQPTVSELVE